MAFRKEAFQAKVLQRLYPAASPKAEKVPDSPDQNLEADSAPKPTKPKQNKAAGSVGACGLPAKKIYTVLLPPEDYRPPSEDEKKLEAISSIDRTTVDVSGSDNSDSAEDQDHVRKRRKRRKKRKAGDAGVGKTGSPRRGSTAQKLADEAEERNGQTLEVPEGHERLSKSRKRKLKKKRQKEKLRSLGMVTKSRPLDFTYTHDVGNEGEENEEENSQKVEEVVDFLRTTWDIYLSDCSSTADGPSISLSTAETLFNCLSEGTAPPAALSSVCRLRTLLGQRDVEQLNTALQQFRQTSTLSTDETVLVHTLFNYWITEVLPMQTAT